MNTTIIRAHLAIVATFLYGFSLADTIHINQYTAQFDDSSAVTRYTYGQNKTDTTGHIVLNFEIGIEKSITIYNHLNSKVGLAVDGQNKNVAIESGQSTTVKWTFTEDGVFKLYDQVSRFGEYMGLTGIAIVSSAKKNKKLFIWNLADFEAAKCKLIAEKAPVNFKSYHPEYFTINGQVYPYCDKDPLVKLTGKVGDTLTLVIINSGFAAHSIHFHGYHATVIKSRKSPYLNGTSKDTLPVKKGDYIELQFIPDKTGKYPAHNHSLSGVISNGLYPSGQFSIISIGN